MKQVTEKQLIKNLTGTINDGRNYSVIDDSTYYWDYRIMDFVNAGCATDDVENADAILVETEEYKKYYIGGIQ